MPETKIAPAPWTAKRYPEGDCWHIHYGDKGCWLGEVYIDGDEKGAEAEARLIAAAPDLLEAADHIDRNATDIADDMVVISGSAYRLMRAAIAKAAGDPNAQ